MTYGAMTLVAVEAGHVVTFLGKTLVVDDEHAVRKGDVLYLTPKNYEALKARLDSGDAK